MPGLCASPVSAFPPANLSRSPEEGLISPEEEASWEDLGHGNPACWCPRALRVRRWEGGAFVLCDLLVTWPHLFLRCPWAIRSWGPFCLADVSA